MPKDKIRQQKSKKVRGTPLKLVPSSLNAHAKAFVSKPMHATITAHELGQLVALPGCKWSAQIFPSKLIIQPWIENKRFPEETSIRGFEQEPLIELAFDLFLAPVPDRFLIELDLKKGQISVEVASGDLFLRWRLYSNEACEPIFELMKFKSEELALNGEFNHKPHVWTPRVAWNLIHQEGSTQARVPRGLEAELWFGTNLKLDWKDLTSMGAQKEAILAWIHQWTLALRWIDPGERVEALVQELRHFIFCENEPFMKRWWQLAVAHTQGCMVPISQKGLPLTSFSLHVLENPLAWMLAMGEVARERWLKLENPQKITLNAEVSSKAPSGRASVKKKNGVNLKWRWRSNRTDLLYLEALETKKNSIELFPSPKRARLTSFCFSKGSLISTEVELVEVCKTGKLLDVELVEDTHYLLDRFEY